MDVKGDCLMLYWLSPFVLRRPDCFQPVCLVQHGDQYVLNVEHLIEERSTLSRSVLEYPVVVFLTI